MKIRQNILNHAALKTIGVDSIVFTNRDNSAEDENDDVDGPPGVFGWSHGGSDDGDDDDFIPGGEEEGMFGGGRFHEGAGLFTFDHEVNEMFRHFDEMFKNFGLADFPPLGKIVHVKLLLHLKDEFCNTFILVFIPRYTKYTQLNSEI